jgi:hypothetical protein
MSHDGLLKPLEETADVAVLGIVVEDLVQQTTLPGAIDGREHAEGTVVQLVGGQVAREVG